MFLHSAFEQEQNNCCVSVGRSTVSQPTRSRIGERSRQRSPRAHGDRVSTGLLTENGREILAISQTKEPYDKLLNVQRSSGRVQPPFKAEFVRLLPRFCFERLLHQTKRPAQLQTLLENVPMSGKSPKFFCHRFSADGLCTARLRLFCRQALA